MSHEIDTTTGNAAVFTTGEPAWHRLGTTIKTAATSAEAIRLAHLDWTVQQLPLFAQQPDELWPQGKMIPVPQRVANVRSDTGAVLGVVGNSYRVFQNSEAFDFMDAIVGEKRAMYETAGALKGGRRVWMLARIPAECRVGDDVVEPYCLLTNAHDGTQSLRMFLTTVRVVCQNTLRYAMTRAGSAGLSIPHWPRLEGRVDAARANLGIIGAGLDQFGKEMKALAARKLSVTESKDYFDGLFPTRTAADRIAAPANDAGLLASILDSQGEREDVGRELLAGHVANTEAEAKRNREILDCVLTNYENERNTLPGIEHSAWSAYNAVSEWADHTKGVRGKTQAEQDDNRLNSIWFGAADKIKQAAYQDALATVG